MKGKLLDKPKFYIYKITFETNEIFDGVKKAEEKYKCGYISSVLNGSRKTAGGYHWERIS